MQNMHSSNTFLQWLRICSINNIISLKKINVMPDKEKELKIDESAKKAEVNAEKPEGEQDGFTNIVTADGKRLKDIKGGYTISGMGADPDEMDFIAV